MLNLKKRSNNFAQILFMVILALMIAVVVVLLVGAIYDSCDTTPSVSLATGEPGNKDPEDAYKTLKTNFYTVLNKYVVPTTVALGVGILTVSLVTLGIQRAKEEDEAKVKAINKRMIGWVIGAVLVFLAPVLTIAIAELAMGFSTGFFNV